MSSKCMATKSLSLYRSILREHKLRLPAKMKSLGDAYVKQEFRLHKEAKPEHLRRFMNSWENYLQTLQKQAEGGGKIGVNIDANDVNRMTEEQKQKMRGLMDKATKWGEVESWVTIVESGMSVCLRVLCTVYAWGGSVVRNELSI